MPGEIKASNAANKPLPQSNANLSKEIRMTKEQQERIMKALKETKLPIMTEKEHKQIMNALNGPSEKHPISTIYGNFKSGDTSYKQYRGNSPAFAKTTFSTIDKSIKKDGYLDGLEICNYRDREIDDAKWNNEFKFWFTFGWLRKGAKREYLNERDYLDQLQKETDDYRKARAIRDAERQ